MSEDEESQSDEISVLQSIYNDEELTIEKSDTRAGQFYAFVSVPERFLVIYKNLMNYQDELESIQVDHLPPISMCFDLPEDYPSRSPPSYKLSCPWLSVKHMVYLSIKLEQLWSENIGIPVLFTWMDFLKNEALANLEISNYLDVRGIFTKNLSNMSRKRCLADRKNKVPPHGKMLKRLPRVSKETVVPPGVLETPEDCDRASESEIHLLGDSNVTHDCSTNSTVDPSPHSNNSPHLPSPTSSLQEMKAVNHNSVSMAKEKFGVDIVKPHYLNTITPDVIMKQLNKVERNYKNNIIALLLTYNEERTLTEFKKGFFSCDICFQSQVGAKCCQFKPCNHTYCTECIHSYFEMRVKENTVQSMPCPHDKCSSEASQNQIKEVLGEELYLRYDRLLLNATLDTMSDIAYCPRKGCQLPVLIESDRMALCPSCSFAFCSLCLRTYHGVQPCSMKNEEKRKLAIKYKEGTRAEQALLEARYGKQQLVSLLQNILSTDWISHNSKDCPSCKTAIEKSDGCNKMVCAKCNTIFCWLCYAVLDREAPYKHFYDLKSKCHNQLFFGLAEPDGDHDDDEDDDDEYFEFYGNEDEDEDDDDIFVIYDEHYHGYDFNYRFHFD